jgi:hypothetical protein
VFTSVVVSKTTRREEAGGGKPLQGVATSAALIRGFDSLEHRVVLHVDRLEVRVELQGQVSERACKLVRCLLADELLLILAV